LQGWNDNSATYTHGSEIMQQQTFKNMHLLLKILLCIKRNKMVATWNLSLGFSLMVIANESELVWRKAITHLEIRYEILPTS
jgi:hypothetical protein